MSIRLLLPVLILCATCAPNSYAQSTEPIDSKHIYGNADLVLVFQIKRLEMVLEPECKAKLESMHEWLRNVTGLDTTKCEEVIMQFGDDEYENPRRVNEYLGFVFRGEDDIPQEQIDGMLEMGPFESEEYNDKTFYIPGGREPGLYFADNSLLIGECDRVRQFIDAEAESLSTREVPLLENTNRNLDICAYVDFSKEQFHAAFQEMMSEVDMLQESDTVERLTARSTLNP